MSHALSKIDLDGNPWTEEEAELFEMLNPYHWNLIAPKFFPNHSRRALHERWVAREQLRAPPSMDEEKEYCSLGYTGSPYYNPYGLADPANLIRAQPIIHKKAKARPYKSRSPSMSPVNGPNYPRPAEAKILKKTGKVIQPKSSKGIFFGALSLHIHLVMSNLSRADIHCRLQSLQSDEEQVWRGEADLQALHSC